MSFLEPWYLLAGLLVVPVWVGPWRARRWAHGVLRMGTLLALVLALAHPVWQRVGFTVQRVIVFDRSASMLSNAAESAKALVAQADASQAVAWIEFGAAPEVSKAPLGANLSLSVQNPEETSPLGQALSRAGAAVPRGSAGSVLLISDGGASGGFPTRALSELWEREIPIAWVRTGEVEGDVRPVGLTPVGGDREVRVGLPSSWWAEVEGSGQLVRCILSDADPGGQNQELARVEHVQLDGSTRVPLTFEPPRAGFVSVRLRVELESGQDARVGNEVLEQTIAVQEALRVAYLGERLQGGAQRLGELLGPGFRVQEPANQANLEGAALVFVDDRPAERLPATLQAEWVRAVTQEGLGLVVAGGEAAFGPGGYHNQPLEDLLPVELVQKEEKRDPSTSLVLIIDTSGSMGGNRVQLAKQVSRLAIRRLLPHDKVGIVEFYGAKRWAVPLQPASNSIEIERALNRLDAGGGTVILPAIEEAYYGLQNVRTRYKHVLILTDGGVEQGAFEPLLRRMADDGINVSTVLVGPDAHSEFLVNLANWGQGRFYSVPDRFNLPEILLKQPASAKLPAYRPGLTQVRVHGGRGWWGEVDPQDVPGVNGYVETRLRPGAEHLMETAAEHHPILASWRFGLGRVTALMTEPVGPGTEAWQEWPGYGALLARTLLRTADDGAEEFAFGMQREGGLVRVVAERRRVGMGQPLVHQVGDVTRPVPLRAVSPDRFEGVLACPQAEDLRLETGTIAGSGDKQRWVLPRTGGPERERQVPTRVPDALADWIERSGGIVRHELPEQLSSLPQGKAERPRASLRLGPWFALLALGFYLLDLLYRRLARSQS